MTTERLPLRRPREGRWVAGVCTGLALHLGFPVAGVRAMAVLLGAAGGAGVLLYGFWWLTIPPGDPRDAAAEARPAALSRLAPRLRGVQQSAARRNVLIALGLLLGAAVLVAVRTGVALSGGWVLPAVIAVVGVGLAWSQLDTQRRPGARRADGRSPSAVLLVSAGLVLVLVGALLFAGQEAGAGTMVRAAMAAVAVLAGVAVVLAPWWWRLVRELGDERTARAREAERADIAAHLHDSVLQTLALVRLHADDAVYVARAARSQERELREWLYADRPAEGTSVAAELRRVVAQVEDTQVERTADGAQPATIETVVVGDAVPDEQSAALLQAVREALVNACAHGVPPVSVYLEVGEESVQAFVRDRGDGFDVREIEPDRFGVRESILGRVRRRGGTAEVVSRPQWGTEVRLSMPRAAALKEDA
ncbi:ATP-binding protein [Paraoerskovia marina]|uniref:ATP-binding protein n=1 Tax=Paraoerskovia marina TaxID=545619 RepID=UPI0005BA44AD|nr:ATP-binding protein [Paraoerskovia marina]